MSRIAIVALACLSQLGEAAAVELLGTYNVDPGQVSVSGYSSGAGLAEQLGIAYSSRFNGVGVFQGIPYDCVRTNSLSGCIYPSVPGIEDSKTNIMKWSGKEIDPISYLPYQRLYFYTSAFDIRVGPLVMAQSISLYSTFVPSANVRSDRLAFPHNFPTDHGSTPCVDIPLMPANCGFDGAGAALQWILGPLKPRREAGPLSGTLIEFDQRPYVLPGHGVAASGWVYVPAACAAHQACRLHVFLIGCQTSAISLGGPFWPVTAGFNEWADANNIIVLYPQSTPDDNVVARDCWDIGGLYDVDYDQKTGTQMTAIVKMVDRVTSGAPTAVAVEYRHAEWDHYFVTAIADEIGKLDAGVFAGWQRTQQTFKVFATAQSDTVPVCRFFTTAFPPTSSHFYAPRGLGCEGTLANADWQFEGDVFHVRLPDANGSCPTGTRPVYRLYNNGQGGAPNHRFTTSEEVRTQMLAHGYVPEGAGIGVGMCSPI